MSARHIVVGIDVGGRRKGFHAVALFERRYFAHIARKIVSAKDKRVVRGELLREAGIDPAKFANIDTIDAALCALTGDYLLAGSTKNYGDGTEGFIVVPG